jgi:hypothetical protein
MLTTGPPTPRILCKFKYCNYSVITSVRNVEKSNHISDFSLAHYHHPETKNFINLKYKKRHNSGKNCRKIVVIKLSLDTPKLHLHTTPSFNPTFRWQVIIRETIWDWHADWIYYYSPPSTKRRGGNKYIIVT